MFGRVSDAGPNHGRCEPWAGRARYEGYGAICEDCGEACERVRLVPEFAFLGCDACYDGCMAMLAEEAAELLSVAARKLAREIWTSQSPSASAIVTLAIAVTGSAG
jgi:hypothetical protein